jgi:DNA polymerase-3 subunit chi
VTRVDFFLLEDAAQAERYACRLVEKVYLRGQRVHVHLASAPAAQDFDRLLWTFEQGSFIPHEAAGGEPGDCPVLLGHDHEPREGCEVLVNLSGEVPPFFSRFERVAEVVGGDAEVMARGRERYRFYRDRGYDLHHHNVGAKGGGR